MSAEDDIPDRRLGGLLRRWAPPAAAAALLAAAVAVFLQASGGMSDAEIAMLKADAARAGRLEIELAELRRGLAGRQSELAALRGELSTAQGQAAAAGEELGRLRQRLRSVELSLASAEAQRRSARALAKKRLADLAAARAKLVAARGDRDLAIQRQQAASAETRKHKDRLMALGREIERLRASSEEALVTSRRLEAELAKLRAEKAAMMLNVQRAYLGVDASQRADLKARQDAARAANLIRRCAELRRTVPDGPVAQLLDRLEVILTRLALLDPYDSLAAETFADLVASAGLSEQIDRQMANALTPTDVRTWLFEAKLILSGVRGAG